MQHGTQRFHLGQVDASIRVLKTLVVDEFRMLMSPRARIVAWSSWMLGVEVMRALLESIFFVASNVLVLVFVI